MEMTLKLPNNYVEIEEEEMMYLDGGWSANKAMGNLKSLFSAPIVAGAAKAMWNWMNKQGAKNVSYAKALVAQAVNAVKMFYLLPWWAKLAGFAAAGFVYAIGTWSIF